MINKLLAKSNGAKLIPHNKNVGIVAKYIAKKLLSPSNDSLLEMIYLCGLLHDIGKSNKRFQGKLEGKPEPKNLKYRHNEVGWAFIYKYFNSKNFDINKISNSIYWHHGISNTMNGDSCEKIINELTETEIDVMKEFVIEILGQNYILSTPRSNKKTPFFYEFDDDGKNNIEPGIIRTCLISADRIVSKLEEEIGIHLEITDNNISSIIDKELDDLSLKNEYLINKSPYQPEDRFNTQLDIVKKCGQTSIIKAPAGFGKTMIGLIWSASNNLKTLWVCPRNIVSRSVYDGVKKELISLGLNNVTVELYLKGEVVEKNHNIPGEFNSDIIITNIDNFETPTINDRISNRLFLINSANVIFDEYHEFVDSSPYYACFINIMRIRNQYTNSRTLLLSATPVDISDKWSTIGTPTTILPNENSHYPAVHNKEYLLRVKDNFKHDITGSDVVIFNSILEAQYYNNEIKKSVLYHSRFTEKAKKEKYDYLVLNYDKNSPKTVNKNTVVSSKIIQASLDISFHKLYESCQSPESTVQRWGRCDRFGDYTTESVVTVFKLQNRNGDTPYSQSERAVVGMFYTKDLMNNWFNELEKYNGQKITLNKLYSIYNDHVKKYKIEREKYFNIQYELSLTSLCKIYPIRYNGSAKTGIITAGSNKLRSTGSEIFYIVQNHNKSTYEGPFTTQIYKSIDEDFEEYRGIDTRMRGTMKAIMKTGNKDFDYTDIIDDKKITLDGIRKYGKKSNTPYPRYDVVYHTDYGIISKENLNNLK